jgi:ATPase subunit of ABC transporter with duplicated ATPase domains
VKIAPRARVAKSKARISAYENLLKEPTAEKLQELQIYIPPGPRLGDIVVEAKNVSKAYGDKLLFENMNFSLPKGGIVGVIGPNGAGKTTLFRMITGKEKPDSGEFKVGSTVKLGYVDQSRDNLKPDNSVWQEISGGNDLMMVGTKEMNSRAYVSRFNFNGDAQQKKVGTLSGGERDRVQLAKVLQEGANLLLLDEPTNDLDVNTMRALEEALLEFGGCAVVISHDRWFLDRICTHILAFEGDSQVYFYPGNYTEYEDDRKKRLGVDEIVPKRIVYKKLQ